MVNRKISKLFSLEVDSDNEGSITIPSSIFIKHPTAIEDIKELITEESISIGQPFYFSTVATNSGIKVSWSKEFKDCLPVLDDEESLREDGLTYIVRKVG